MKKHLFILSTLVLLAFSCCSKYAGDPITKDFDISATYTELEVHNSFEITVSDAATQITVTAGENVMPNVVVEMDGNKLVIKLKPLANSYGSDMKVVLPYNTELTSVDLSGASEFHSEYGLDGEKVEVNLSGASEFHGDIDADQVEIELSGSSDFYGDIDADEIEMELSGGSNVKGHVTATDLDLELSGASDVILEGDVVNLDAYLSGSSSIAKKVVGNRYGLVCDQFIGDMSGGSAAYIHSDGSIKARLSGGSELHYTGNASTTGSECTGGSEISHDVL